jgi:hypothetical protein
VGGGLTPALPRVADNDHNPCLHAARTVLSSPHSIRGHSGTLAQPTALSPGATWPGHWRNRVLNGFGACRAERFDLGGVRVV